MFALKIVSISLLYDVDHRLKSSEKPSENLLDTRIPTRNNWWMPDAMPLSPFVAGVMQSGRLNVE